MSKQKTSPYFVTTEDYLTFRRHWGELMRSEQRHELRAVHHLIYLVLDGKDWRKAFTFPTDRNKLDNGYSPALNRALRRIAWPCADLYLIAPFAELVSLDALKAVRKNLAHVLYARPHAGSDGHPDCLAFAPRTAGPAKIPRLPISAVLSVGQMADIRREMNASGDDLCGE